MLTRQVLCTLLVVWLSSTALGAQTRAIVEQNPDPSLRVMVKFTDASGAMLTAEGQLEGAPGVDLSFVARRMRAAGRIERVAKQPIALLDSWYRLADERLPKGLPRPGHLARWLRVHARDHDEARALIEWFKGQPLVEDAYLEPEPILAGDARGVANDIPPPTPDFTARQAYRASAPSGFAVDATHSLFGARADSIRFYHIEDDWFVRHEDLETIDDNSYLGGVTGQNTGGANHGTGVIGAVAATRNGYGMTGIADLATVRLVAWGNNGGVPDAIVNAIAEARAGDVITMIAGYNLRLTKPDDYVPIEYFQAPFDAILTGTALGIVFLEAALNGDNDLDDPRFAHRFDRSFRDSGAIMVGATDGPLLVRASFSNYGSRIDCNGWGGQVATTGYGDLFYPNMDVLQAYSQGYAGTSAATALLSGVVVSLQGTVERQLGRRMTPLELRALLRAHGTPIPGEIGRRPDMAAMLASLGLPDALRLSGYEVALGSALDFTMNGPPNSGFALSLALAPGDLDVGLGRHLHLDPASFVPVASFALPTGSASWSVVVPNDPSLRGIDLWFQGVLVDPQGAAHLSSSHTVWLR